MLEKCVDKYKQLPIPLKATLWFLFCNIMQKGVSAITVPIFTRIMSTAEYGQYSTFDSWLRIVTVIVSLSLYQGVYMRGLVKYEDERDKYTSSMQGLSLTLVVIWAIIYYIFSDFWNKLFSSNTIQMTSMILIIWATSVYSFWSAEQRVEYKYRYLVIVTLFVSVVQPILEVILVLNSNDKVTARIIGMAIVQTVVYSILFIIHMKKGKVFFSKEIWKHALWFNLPLLPHYLSQIVLNSTDRIMISKMVGDDAAGIYSLAYSISLLMQVFISALTRTVEPWCYKKIKEGKSKEIGNIAYVSLIVVALLNIMLIVFAPEIIAIFAPKEYYDAIWIIPPVSVSTYFMFAYIYFGVFSFYYEKTKYVMYSTVVGAVLNIVLNYIFIDIFGYYAAGYTTLVCYLMYFVCHYISMRKVSKDYLNNIKVFSVKKLVCISLAFMLVSFVILLTYLNIVIRYALIILAFIVMVILRKKINSQIGNIVSTIREK